MQQGIRIAHALAVFATLCVMLITLKLPETQQLHTWYDFKARSSLQDIYSPETRIVIIDIDEKSLVREGRWPWPRQRISKLVETLFVDYQIGILGIDVLFPDATNADSAFFEALSPFPIVYSQAFQLPLSDESLGSTLTRGRLQSPVEIISDADAKLPEALGYLASRFPDELPAIGGHITPLIDRDGVVRRMAPLIQWQGRYYEMLSLSMLRQLYMLDANYQLDAVPASSSEYQVLSNGPVRIALDSKGFAQINLNSRPGDKVLYISATDVLDKGISRELLEGKVVILGSTATRLYDQVVTPTASVYPAVELHAHLLADLLDQRQWRYTPQWELWGLCITIALSCFACILFVYKQMTRLALLSVVLVSLIWCCVAFFVWPYWHLRIWPVLLSAVVLLVLYVPAVLTLQLQQRRVIKSLFSTYVPADVVNALLRQPDQAIGMIPEKRHMTVLFADMKGFSRLAETTSPERLAAYMKRVFDALTEAVYQHGGTVDKYMGDEVMAFWGAPLEDARHAENAVKAAILMQAALDRLADQFLARGEIPPSVGIGINTGEMVVGDMGSSYRRSYTVIGDSVNLAERLQKYTRQCDYDVVISRATLDCLSGSVGFTAPHAIGKVVLPGRNHAVELFGLSGRQLTESPKRTFDVSSEANST